MRCLGKKNTSNSGYAALISQVRKNAAKYGETAVVALIRECMAANWQGIIWDKLDKPHQGKLAGNGAFDPQPSEERIRKNSEWLEKFLEEQGGEKT